jgi:hypothetical protein
VSEKELLRFMAKVQRGDGCWLWTAAKDSKGYGRFSLGGSHTPEGKRRNSMVAAHRFSYESVHGPIPSGPGFHGYCVLHRCDNPSCVRPDHLFLGTNKDNVQDMDRKGRRVNAQKRGNEHPNARLTPEKVARIYQMACAREKPQWRIAQEFGVCLATVNHIKTGRLWAHLTGAA